MKTVAWLVIWLPSLILAADSVNTVNGVSYRQILEHIAALESLPEPVNLTASFDSIDEAYQVESIGKLNIFARYISDDPFQSFGNQEMKIKIFVSNTADPRDELATIAYCSCRIIVEEDLSEEDWKISYDIRPKISPPDSRGCLIKAVGKLLDLYLFH